MKYILSVSLRRGAVSGSCATEVSTGIISDDMCAKGDHSRMQMGPNDAECTRRASRCMGRHTLLYDGKSEYVLSDQKLPEKFAGQKVAVVGALDAKTKTIKVESIKAAK
jgi:hypothetical protein